MPEYSNSLMLTWQVAAMEACAGKHSTIKPGHYFIALCKMGDLPVRNMVEQVEDDNLRACLPQIEADISELQRVFATVDFDVVRFRRRLRAVLGSEHAVAVDGLMHRDPDARLLCERSKESVPAHVGHPGTAHLSALGAL